VESVAPGLRRAAGGLRIEFREEECLRVRRPGDEETLYTFGCAEGLSSRPSMQLVVWQITCDHTAISEDQRMLLSLFQVFDTLQAAVKRS
jgi:hypothetical protein